MSLRNLKKYQEARSPPNPVVIDSDDDFEPLYAQRTTKSTYEGLQLSSSSSEEENNGEEETLKGAENAPTGKTSEDPIPGCSQKPEVEKKKKKKQKKKKNRRAADDFIDEIDRSVSEVNALLGEPTVENVLPDDDVDENRVRLFTINVRHLNKNNELNRLFGPDTEDESRKKKKGRRPQFKRIHKCNIVQKDYDFKKLGLSMTMLRNENGLKQFVYNHSEEHQKKHKAFLAYMELRNRNLMLPRDAALKDKHIEALIEATDMLFYMEEYSEASDIIEEAIAYLEYVAHPSFNVVDLNTRLEYKYLENRAFHIMILKYIHLLSNQACHRTALELAKLLLNLDTSDPLAVVLIIDTLAIRAKEYKWLVDAISYLDKEREAGYLFNIKFSKALANFFIATKEGGSLASCDSMLKHALLAYPWALREILEVADRKKEPVLTCKLFDDFARKTTSKYLKQLIHLYAAFTMTQWRMPRVLEWFLRNANAVAQTNAVPNAYDEEIDEMSGALSLERVRRYMFRTYPVQIQRHLTVIKTMNNLLVEGAVPEVTKTRSFDPIPPGDSVNRYGYTLQSRSQLNRGRNVFTDLFASILPNYEILYETVEREE